MSGGRGSDVQLPSSKWSDTGDERKTKVSYDPVKNPLKLEESLVTKGKIKDISSSQIDPRKKRLQRNVFNVTNFSNTEIKNKSSHGRTIVAPPTMVPPPSMVPPPVMVPPPSKVPPPATSQRQLDRDKLKAQELAIKKVQAVVNGHEKAVGLQQKTPKKPVLSPGENMGNALLNFLALAKTSGKVPTPSSDKKMDSKAAVTTKGRPQPVPIPLQSNGPLVDYTQTTTEDSESEDESTKVAATKAFKEIAATDAMQDNSSTVASKVSDVFKRLGKKVGEEDSIEEGEISENSSARQEVSKLGSEPLSLSDSESEISDEEKKSKKSGKRGRKNKKKKSKRSRSTSSDSRSSSEESGDKKSKQNKKSRQKKKKKHRKRSRSSSSSLQSESDASNIEKEDKKGTKKDKVKTKDLRKAMMKLAKRKLKEIKKGENSAKEKEKSNDETYDTKSREKGSPDKTRKFSVTDKRKSVDKDSSKDRSKSRDRSDKNRRSRKDDSNSRSRDRTGKDRKSMDIVKEKRRSRKDHSKARSRSGSKNRKDSKDRKRSYEHDNSKKSLSKERKSDKSRHKSPESNHRRSHDRYDSRSIKKEKIDETRRNTRDLKDDIRKSRTSRRDNDVLLRKGRERSRERKSSRKESTSPKRRSRSSERKSRSLKKELKSPSRRSKSSEKKSISPKKESRNIKMKSAKKFKFPDGNSRRRSDSTDDSTDNEAVARVPIRPKSSGTDEFDRRRSELLKRKQGGDDSCATANNNKRIKMDNDGEEIEKNISRTPTARDSVTPMDKSRETRDFITPDSKHKNRHGGDKEGKKDFKSVLSFDVSSDEPVCIEEMIIAEEIGEDGTINKTVLESSIDRLEASPFPNDELDISNIPVPKDDSHLDDEDVNNEYTTAQVDEDAKVNNVVDPAEFNRLKEKMKAAVKIKSQKIEEKKVVEFKLQSKNKLAENKLEQTFETALKPAPIISMDSKQIFNRIYQNNLKVDEPPPTSTSATSITAATAVKRKYVLNADNVVTTNEEFKQEIRKVSIKDDYNDQSSFEETETRVVKTLASPDLTEPQQSIDKDDIYDPSADTLDSSVEVMEQSWKEDQTWHQDGLKINQTNFAGSTHKFESSQSSDRYDYERSQKHYKHLDKEDRHFIKNVYGQLRTDGRIPQTREPYPISTSSQHSVSPSNQHPVYPSNQHPVLSPSNHHPVSPSNHHPVSPSNQHPLSPSNQHPLSPTPPEDKSFRRRHHLNDSKRQEVRDTPEENNLFSTRDPNRKENKSADYRNEWDGRRSPDFYERNRRRPLPYYDNGRQPSADNDSGSRSSADYDNRRRHLPENERGGRHSPKDHNNESTDNVKEEIQQPMWYNKEKGEYERPSSNQFNRKSADVESNRDERRHSSRSSQEFTDNRKRHNNRSSKEDDRYGDHSNNSNHKDVHYRHDQRDQDNRWKQDNNRRFDDQHKRHSFGGLDRQQRGENSGNNSYVAKDRVEEPAPSVFRKGPDGVTRAYSPQHDDSNNQHRADDNQVKEASSKYFPVSSARRSIESSTSSLEGKEAASEYFPVCSVSRRSIDPFITTKQAPPVIWPDNSTQKKDRSSHDRSSFDRDVDNRRQRFEGGRSHRDNQFRNTNRPRRLSGEERSTNSPQSVEQEIEESRPELSHTKNPWDYGRGVWDIISGEYIKTEDKQEEVNHSNTKLIPKLSKDPEQMALVKKMRCTGPGSVGVKVPDYHALERNYKMDNLNLKICRGGEKENEWLYIQDDIRWVNGFDKLSEEMHDYNIKQLRKPDKFEIIKHFNIPIEQHDILTLTGLRWINDQCIEFYLQMIAARNNTEEAKKLGFPSIYPMNTYFFTRLMGGGHEKVKNWTKKVNIFDYDVVIFPIHLMQIHWSVIVVDFRVPGVFYWDSMKAEDNDIIMCRAYCSEIIKYLKEEHKAKLDKDICLKNYVKDVIDHCPQQENGSDCGMFICKVVESLSRNVEPSFEQQDLPYFRQRMLWEICNNKLISP